MTEQVSIRKMVPEDEPFIYATWLNHYKRYSQFAKRIKHGLFFSKHHMIIERILGRKAVVKIAHPKDDPQIILGFLAMEGTNDDPIIHFILVKEAFQRMGVASAMTKGLDLSRCVFTHWTESTDWIVKKCPEATYDPYSV